MTSDSAVSGEGVGISGRNGVAVVHRKTTTGEGFRTYEVHQRERVGESTHQIKPIQLISEEYRCNPYPLLNLLRDHYPFYRDWLGNRYWLTPYNEVTSVFTDDANFETRPKLWFYGMQGLRPRLGRGAAGVGGGSTSLARPGSGVSRAAYWKR